MRLGNTQQPGPGVSAAVLQTRTLLPHIRTEHVHPRASRLMWVAPGLCVLVFVKAHSCGMCKDAVEASGGSAASQ